MSKIFKRISILVGIFIVAAGIYFILAQKSVEKSDTVYTSMEEATLPVVYTDMFGLKTNRLAGYLQEMQQKTARDALTVLPEDRRLKLNIQDFGNSVLAVQYEIRSMDLSRLVERTEVSDWSSQDGTLQVTLPIQNLLTRGSQYLLHLTLQTEQHGDIHYYTRIMQEQEPYAEEMVRFAREFSESTLNSEQAKSLVTYLETSSTEDNSSLGNVTIKSNFSNLTWAGLKMRLQGEMDVTLKEVNGIMGQVRVQYHLTREAEDGVSEFYDVTDYYTVKWNSQRLYLMDFNRVTNQVFSGGRELYSGKRILLGIGNDDAVAVKPSGDKRYLAYAFNRDLWSYDQKEGRAVKVFSFRSGTDASGRSTYDQHDIEILSVNDQGDIDFLIYGYMNRGKHEGYTGISLCRYDQESGSIQERFFVPVGNTYESIRQDVETLTYLSSGGMLYLLLDHAVYAVDLSSNEYMVVADGLSEGSYAISDDRRSLAWQEGADLYGSKTIHLMNLETGQKQEIAGEGDSYLRTIGFVRGDFVYGLANPEDLWTIHGRIEDLPMYALRIVDENLTEETRYEKAGYYLSDVSVEDARIHMKRLIKDASGEYEHYDDDTIVCNTAAEIDKMAGIGWYASETRFKLYFIQLDNEIKTGKTIKISVPKKITYDVSEVLTLKSNQQVQDMVFYAYSQGNLKGTSTDFSTAVQMAYDKMGFVTDASQRILWDRVNRSNSRTIRDPQNAANSITKQLETFTDSQDLGDGVLMLDARGCMLNQMLYFIDQGYPVIAYTDRNHYILLYGYDQYNISLYDPATGQTSKMGLNDAGEYFSEHRNDFVCGVAAD